MTYRIVQWSTGNVGKKSIHAIAAKGSGIFREAVLLVADALGAELDEVRCDAE